MKLIRLPFPPSVNSIWSKGRHGNTFLSKPAREFYNRCKFIKQLKNPLDSNTSYKAYVFLVPPDNRKRDVDNYTKCIYDAFQRYEYIKNDNQIKSQDVNMCLKNKELSGAYIYFEELEEQVDITDFL